MLLIFLISLWVSPVVALFGIGTKQSIAATGTLMCKGEPAKDIIVKLYDWENTISSLMDSTTTDANGTFHLSGYKTEITKIEPHLAIYHKCDYNFICFLRFYLELPRDYVTDEEFPNRTYDIRTINLEMFATRYNRPNHCACLVNDIMAFSAFVFALLACISSLITVYIATQELEITAQLEDKTYSLMDTTFRLFLPVAICNQISKADVANFHIVNDGHTAPPVGRYNIAAAREEKFYPEDVSVPISNPIQIYQDFGLGLSKEKTTEAKSTLPKTPKTPLASRTPLKNIFSFGRDKEKKEERVKELEMKTALALEPKTPTTRDESMPLVKTPASVFKKRSGESPSGKKKRKSAESASKKRKSAESASKRKISAESVSRRTPRNSGSAESASQEKTNVTKGSNEMI